MNRHFYFLWCHLYKLLLFENWNVSYNLWFLKLSYIKKTLSRYQWSFPFFPVSISKAISWLLTDYTNTTAFPTKRVRVRVSEWASDKSTCAWMCVHVYVCVRVYVCVCMCDSKLKPFLLGSQPFMQKGV